MILLKVISIIIGIGIILFGFVTTALSILDDN